MSVQHLPVPYLEVTSASFGEAATQFVLESHGIGIELLRGPCPRCCAIIEVPVFEWAVEGRELNDGRGNNNEGGIIEPVICTCNGSHEGRPEGRVGCGAYWNFFL